MELARQSSRRLVPVMAGLIQTLDDEQVKEFLKNYDLRARKYEQERLLPARAKRLKYHTKRMSRLLARWIGSPTKQQAARIAQWAKQLSFDINSRLEQRRRFRSYLTRILMLRQQPQKMAAMLEQLMVYPDRQYTAAYRKYSNYNRDKTLQLLADIHASLTTKQKKTLLAKLRQYQVDFQLLASQKPIGGKTMGINPIKQIIRSDVKDLGGFSVRRLLPSQNQRQVGPWVFFDHMGPADFSPGPGINVRPHPHINLATVTYLFEGEMFHRDSLGNAKAIRPGDINLMIAGRGIVHSERETAEAQQTSRHLHGLQLWLALPEADEECEPAFIHYPSTSIPAVTIHHVPVRVMIGSAYGVTSPVKTFAETFYLEADLKNGQSLVLPDNIEERAVYVASGKVELNGERLPEYSMTVLEPHSGAEIVASDECRVAFIGGEKLSKRHIWWNFVSSRKERIEQAKQAWKEGQFPKVPGDEEEFIPLPV